MNKIIFGRVLIVVGSCALVVICFLCVFGTQVRQALVRPEPEIYCYQSYIPGDSDQERWAWLATHIKEISSADRKRIRILMLSSSPYERPGKVAFFRITERSDDEKAFPDRFFGLRIEFDDSDRVKQIGILKIDVPFSASISRNGIAETRSLNCDPLK